VATGAALAGCASGRGPVDWTGGPAHPQPSGEGLEGLLRRTVREPPDRRAVRADRAL